jgi:hypothetical protein
MSSGNIPPGVDPVDWAVTTGRVTPTVADYYWREELRKDPQRVTQVLAALAPTHEPGQVTTAGQRPTSVAASAFRPPAGTEAHYARNPFVDQVRQSPTDSGYVAAAAAGTPPTLFESGDLPPFTSSGIDPSELMRVPWYGRHSVAAAATTSQAYEMIEDMSGEDGLVYALSTYRHHRGNQEYESRVTDWLIRGATADGKRQRYEEASRRIAASSGPAVSASELTDEQAYEAVFGDLDREQEARQDEHDRAILEGRSVLSGYRADQVERIRARVVARAQGGNGRPVSY